jgi:plastocyanin
VDADDDRRPGVRGLGAVVLGNPATAGIHAGTLTFTATRPGAYHYLCPVPGHADKGMTGAFTVSNS